MKKCKCGKCRKDIGEVESIITTSGEYATESGVVDISLKCQRVRILSARCNDCYDPYEGEDIFPIDEI